MLDDVMVHSYTKSAPWNMSRGITFEKYEEVIYRSSDGLSIYIFSPNHPTEHRFVHLTDDHTYDMSQAMQNIGHNQPTHLGYYIGEDEK